MLSDMTLRNSGRIRIADAHIYFVIPFGQDYSSFTMILLVW